MELNQVSWFWNRQGLLLAKEVVVLFDEKFNGTEMGSRPENDLLVLVGL
jgi:hypothetical protein